MLNLVHEVAIKEFRPLRRTVHGNRRKKYTFKLITVEKRKEKKHR